MSGFKYIMFATKVRGATDDNGTQQIPIIFPGDIAHCDMADAMARVFHHMRREAMPVSAGFLRVNAMNVGGKSESMGDLASREEDDERIINSHPYMHGMGFDLPDPKPAQPEVAFVSPRFPPTKSARLRNKFKDRR